MLNCKIAQWNISPNLGFHFPHNLISAEYLECGNWHGAILQPEGITSGICSVLAEVFSK